MEDINKILKNHNSKLSIENLELYKNKSTKTNFICECGNKWTTSLKNVLKSNKNNGCIKCQKRRKSERIYTLSNEVYLKRVEDYWGNKVKVLDKYEKGCSKIKALCTVCDNIWKPIARALLRGNGCPKCGHNRNKISQLKSNNEYKEQVKSLHCNRIIPLDNYKNSNIKIRLMCCLCNNIWTASPRMTLKGRGCPKCNCSKGELLISGLLKNMGVSFKEQFIISGLKTTKGGTPRFDFAIFENNILTKIIEYDGILHFNPIKRFGGEKRLIDQKRIDSFKDQYCLNNNIKMIRIPYTDLYKLDINYLIDRIKNN